jgi:hypothetical protein
VDGALIAEDTTDASISGMVGIEGADTSTEDGEIVEVSPFAGPLPLPHRQARDESVSHDSDDYEIQPSQPRTREADVEGGDSRYKALKKGKAKAPVRGKGKAGQGKEIEVISDSDSDGSSIIAISRPLSPKEKPNGSSKGSKGKSAEKASLPNGPGGVGKKEKREFWLAKAGSKQEEGEIEDEFGGGADFVRL